MHPLARELYIYVSIVLLKLQHWSEKFFAPSALAAVSALSYSLMLQPRSRLMDPRPTDLRFTKNIGVGIRGFGPPA